MSVIHKMGLSAITFFYKNPEVLMVHCIINSCKNGKPLRGKFTIKMHNACAY